MPGTTQRRVTPTNARKRRRSPFAAAADILNPQPHKHLRNPVGWITERLGGFLWSKQRDVARSVVENRYTAVKSCFDSGKSWEASALACWWLDTHPVGTAFVVTTAPTDPQVKAILWREIQKRFDDAEKVGDPLPGYVTQDAKWKINDKLVAFGRKPADYNETAFQGIHELYVLVIMDEADGIPQSLWDAADGLVTNEYARVLAIGNPMDPAGPFAKACKPGSGWHVIQISAWDTPNFTGEVVPEYLYPLLVSKTWVDERRKRWGVGTPRWVSKVEGDFPDISDDTLIEPKWIEAAQRRVLKPDPTDARLGVDVARYGADETIIILREGTVARTVHVGHKAGTMETAGWVARTLREHSHAPVANVDDDGVGGGVTDRLAELGAEVCPIHGGAEPVEKDSYYNKRAEMYWNLRLAFEEGSIDIDPTDEDLAAQLGAIKYKLDSRGRIKLETKDEMRKRGLPSPDRADALAYSWDRASPMMIGTDTTAGITGDLLTKKW